MRRTTPSVLFFRNFIFGVEDSLVSTVGLLSGIALATVPEKTIFLTGVVLVFVEAFSMSAGSFLSESSAEDYANSSNAPTKNPVFAALIMFVSYFVSGFIPIFPYLIFPTDTALPVSIGLSVIALFILGTVSAAVSSASLIKNGLRMALIGGLAIAVGALAGTVVSLA